jgi:hypothetical protein
MEEYTSRLAKAGTQRNGTVRDACAKKRAEYLAKKNWTDLVYGPQDGIMDEKKSNRR